MTKDEAIANLKKGATSTNSQYLTVTREQLLIALGVEPGKKDEATSDGSK